MAIAGKLAVLLEVRDKLSAGLKKASMHVGAMGKKMAGLRQHAAKLGIAFGVMGTAIMLALKKAIDMFSRFETVMTHFRLIAGISHKEAAKWAKEFERLSVKWGRGADEIAQGALNIMKAGYKAEDAMKILNASLMLATRGQYSMEQATADIMTTLKQFNMTAEQAIDVFNTIRAAADITRADYQDFGEALKYVGGFAASMNYDFKEVIGTIAYFRDKGLEAATAGMYLKKLLSSSKEQ